MSLSAKAAVERNAQPHPPLWLGDPDMKDDPVYETLEGSGIHDSWQSAYRRPDVEPLIRAYLAKLTRRLGLSKGATILDAGCGTAFNAVALAQLGFRVDGVDLSHHALDGARRFAEQKGVGDRITLAQGDLTALPIADCEYEAVVCLGVLMHVPDIDKAIGELARVTRPGGQLLIGENNLHSAEFLLNRAYWRLFKRRTVAVENHPGHTIVWFDSPDGKFMSRTVARDWLIAKCKAAGLDHVWTQTGDLTELYARNRIVGRRFLIGLNRLWFRLNGSARLASGFYAAFRKP